MQRDESIKKIFAEKLFVIKIKDDLILRRYFQFGPIFEKNPTKSPYSRKNEVEELLNSQGHKWLLKTGGEGGGQVMRPGSGGAFYSAIHVMHP